MNILTSIAHGTIRYFSQLGHITNGGIKKINSTINRRVRNTLTTNGDTPSTYLFLDRNYGGAGIKSTEEIVAFSRIATLLHSLNCKFILTKLSTSHELKLANLKPLNIKSQNPITATLAIMHQIGLSFIRYNSSTNQIEQFPFINTTSILDTGPTYTIPANSKNSFLIYVDASFDKPWKPAGPAITYQDINYKFIDFRTF